MIVKARIESVRFEEFDIPEYLAKEYEKDIELNIPQGEYPSIRMIRSWAKAKGIRLVSAYGEDV